MPPYRVNGALMTLDGVEHPLVIDLLEWQSPSDDSPPYPHLYHLGIARLALATADMDADLAALEALGVEFIGPQEGLLACGYEGIGRLWPVEEVATHALRMLQ